MSDKFKTDILDAVTSVAERGQGLEFPLTKRLKKLEKINDRLIYIADIYIEIERKKIRSKNKRKYTVKEYRSEILKDQVYESKPKPLNEEYFIKECKRKVDLHKEETMEITKIVLKKEIGCSIYE